MFNQPFNQLISADTASTSADRFWDIDSHPLRRLAFLFVLILFPICLISARLYFLQGMRQIDISLPPSQITTTDEATASLDGRILAADGRILAYDVERYHIRMNYRWLEKPPNARWLHETAYARINKESTSKQRQLSFEKQKLLKQREQLWKNISILTLTTESELEVKRSQIQKRIERIIQIVKDRRKNKRIAQHPATNQSTDKTRPWVQSAWEIVSKTLTSPPVRDVRDTVVIKEELSDHIIFEYADKKIAEAILQHPEMYPAFEYKKPLSVRIHKKRLRRMSLATGANCMWKI